MRRRSALLMVLGVALILPQVKKLEMQTKEGLLCSYIDISPVWADSREDKDGLWTAVVRSGSSSIEKVWPILLVARAAAAVTTWVSALILLLLKAKPHRASEGQTKLKHGFEALVTTKAITATNCRLARPLPSLACDRLL